MVVKILLLSESIKEFLVSAGKFVKKYWQFFLGLSIGLVTFLISRDRNKIDKALGEIKKIDKEERDKNIEISNSKSEKVDQAVRDFIENDSKASEKHKDRISEIESESDAIKSNLLEKEKESPGTIAEEINKIVK